MNMFSLIKDLLKLKKIKEIYQVVWFKNRTKETKRQSEWNIFSFICNRKIKYSIEMLERGSHFQILSYYKDPCRDNLYQGK